jgi:uncharacterized protein (DUF983 family)
MSLWTILWRSLRLRCPACGKGRLFRRWFSMHETCGECELKFAREAGFFLGSIYVNYGLTALIVAVAYPILLFGGFVPEQILLAVSAVFVFVFPIAFFPLARSLWLGFDQYLDPRQGKKEQRGP